MKKTICIIAVGIVVKIIGFIILTTFLTSFKNPPQNQEVEEEYRISKIETFANYIKTIKNEKPTIKS